MSRNVVIATVAMVCAVALFGAWAAYSFSQDEDAGVTYESVDSIDGFDAAFVSGTQGACVLSRNSEGEHTVRFRGLSEDSVYELSGMLKGNIIAECGGHSLEIRLNGMSVSSARAAPLEAFGSGTLRISVVGGTENRISDFRLQDGSGYAVVSGTDMEITGEGYLKVESTRNGGMRSSGSILMDPGEIVVESRMDSVVSDGNVGVAGGSFAAMSHAGTGISGKDVAIGGSGPVEASVLACAIGIDASGDLDVKDGAELSVRTSDMSKRPELTDVYVGYSNQNFTFSLKATTDSGTVWINPSGDPVLVHRAMARSYVYEFEVPVDARSFEIYAYSSSQVQGQDSSYYSRSAPIQKDFGYSSLLITQCASGTEIRFVPADYGGPGMPDMGESRTIGMRAAGGLSITGASVSVRSEGAALASQSDVAISDSYLTAFSRADTVRASGNLSMKDGRAALFSDGNDGFVLSCGGELSFDGSYLVGVCADSPRNQERLASLSDSVPTSGGVLQGTFAGSRLAAAVDGTDVCVVTVPDGSTGGPPRDIPGHEPPGGRPMGSVMAFLAGSGEAALTVSDSTGHELDGDGVYWGPKQLS